MPEENDLIDNSVILEYTFIIDDMPIATANILILYAFRYDEFTFYLILTYAVRLQVKVNKIWDPLLFYLAFLQP